MAGILICTVFGILLTAEIKEVKSMEYVKPEVMILNLAEDESLVAMARCNGGAHNKGSCS